MNEQSHLKNGAQASNLAPGAGSPRYATVAIPIQKVMKLDLTYNMKLALEMFLS